MSEILYKIWIKKFKVIDDLHLFKLFFLCGMGLFTLLVILCEILLLNSNDYLLLFIINALLIVYNKPTILSNIQRKISTTFFIEKKVLSRYILFQVLKENFFIIAATIAFCIVFVYSFFVFKPIHLCAILFLTINIYLLDVYKGLYKIALLFFSVIDIFLLLTNVSYILPVFALASICNSIFIWNTFYNQLINSIFRNKYTNVLSGKCRITAIHANILFMLRMSLDKVIELIFQVVLLCIASRFADISIIYFILVAIFIVDIELISDEKMKEFQFYYNKRNFLSSTGISNIRRFVSSMEFNYVIKYAIILFLISLSYAGINGFMPELLWMYGNLMMLFYAVAYRYYLATDNALKSKTDLKSTWFRLIMLYLILFNLAPYIFVDTLNTISGYKNIYGYIFTVFINLLLLFVKVEKLAGGDHFDNINKNTAYSQ